MSLQTHADVCPVCGTQPAAAGFSGACDRWCEQELYPTAEGEKRLREAAPETAPVEGA